MYYINNETRENVKTLNIENKKALRGLSDNFDFDFEKPFFIVRFEGKFTFNSVKKAIPGKYAGNAALLIKRQGNGFRENKLYLVRMGSTKFYCGDRYNRFTTWRYDLDYFYGVGDFEAARKTCTEHYYIIAQAPENARTTTNRAPIDRRGRHRIKDKWTAKTIMVDEWGREWDYCRSYYPGKTDKLPILDKSGYLYADAVTGLYTRLRNYKAAKAERAAALTDFDDAENAVINALRDKRETIASLLTTPKASEEISELEKMLNKLRWVLWAWERYNEGKNTATATARKRQLDNMLADLDKIKFELYTGGAGNANIA